MQPEEHLGKMSNVGGGQVGETEAGTVLRGLDLAEYIRCYRIQGAIEFKGCYEFSRCYKIKG